MPNTFKEFKKYLQFLTSCEQINHMIHDILMYNNPDDNISKKYRVIKELNIIEKQLLHTHNENNKN